MEYLAVIVFCIWFWSRMTDNKPPPEDKDLHDVLEDKNVTVGSLIKAIDDKLVSKSKQFIDEVKELQEEQKDIPPEKPAELIRSGFVGLVIGLFWVFISIVVLGGGMLYVMLHLPDWARALGVYS